MFRPTPESIILQVEQNASPNKADTVLTWPEGNARLAHHLQKYVAGKSLKNHLYNIKRRKQSHCHRFDNKTKTSTTITADKIC
jgi:hypothetical protein